MLIASTATGVPRRQLERIFVTSAALRHSSMHKAGSSPSWSCAPVLQDDMMCIALARRRHSRGRHAVSRMDTHGHTDTQTHIERDKDIIFLNIAYIYMYIYIHLYIYIYTHIYICTKTPR